MYQAKIYWSARREGVTPIGTVSRAATIWPWPEFNTLSLSTINCTCANLGHTSLPPTVLEIGPMQNTTWLIPMTVWLYLDHAHSSGYSTVRVTPLIDPSHLGLKQAPPTYHKSFCHILYLILAWHCHQTLGKSDYNLNTYPWWESEDNGLIGNLTDFSDLQDLGAGRKVGVLSNLW